MAFIDCVSWDPSGSEALFYRYPEENLSTYTQLIVNEAQQAILLSNGRIVGKFGAGRHTLNTENLPLLRELYGFPFGGKNPFPCTVYFVSLVESPTISWATTGFRTYDPNFNVSLPVIAKGRYGVRVENAEMFWNKIVATKNIFTVDDLTNVIWTELTSELNSCISAFMRDNGLGIMSITPHLVSLSTHLRDVVAQFLTKFGVALQSFNITSIDVDDSTEEGRRVINAIVDRSTQNIAGYSWQQKQAFATMNNAVNRGSGMGMLGMALMMGSGGGGMGTGMMQGSSASVPVTPTAVGKNLTGGVDQTGTSVAVSHDVYCSCCARKFPNTSKFCPYCGNEYHPCPRCGCDNNSRAKLCVSCGTPLGSGSSETTVDSPVCSRCGATIARDVKFCSNCGNKVR